MLAAWILGAGAVGVRGRTAESYRVYRPDVERHWVVNAEESPLKYNHCASVARYGDRWILLWNANTTPAEGATGQLIYMSDSPDGVAWSAPVPVFSDPDTADVPIPSTALGTSSANTYQWQPCLIAVDGELWALWRHLTSDTAWRGVWFSRLREPGAKWENRRLTWNGSWNPVLDGRSYDVMPTQNATRLASGRVLQPVSLIGPRADDAPDEIEGWWGAEKLNAVIYTDDLGETWHMSGTTGIPGRTWANWEPTVWESDDGAVRMVARNNDRRNEEDGGPGMAEYLWASESRDQGLTWSPMEVVPLVTIMSRMHVLPLDGGRFVMAHNDAPYLRRHTSRDRRRISLYFQRGAGFGFAPGANLTGEEPQVSYPHLWSDGSRLLMAYSIDNSRSVKVAHVWPLPDPNERYILPRGNVPPNEAPQPVGPAHHYDGSRRIESTAILQPGTRFSFGAWVRSDSAHALFDNRSPGAGFLFGIGETGFLRPVLWLGTPEGNLYSQLPVTPGEWNYVGFSADGDEGTVTFFVNEDSESMAFTAPLSRSMAGEHANLGFPRLAGSAWRGMNGELGPAAFYAGAVLGGNAHRWLYNGFADRVGREPLPGAVAPGEPPVMRLEARDPAYRFDGTGHVEALRRPVPDGIYSIGVWLKTDGAGVIFDNRAGDSGHVFGVRNPGALHPFLAAGTPEGNLSPSLTIPPGEWTYVGVTFDNLSGTARFTVNTDSETVPFTAPSPRPAAGAWGRIGERTVGGIAPFVGEMRDFELHDAAAWNDAQHRCHYDRVAPLLGRPPSSGGSEPPPAGAIRVDFSNRQTFRDTVHLPDGLEGWTGRARDPATGADLLIVSGQASAGLELPAAEPGGESTVAVRFRFRIESGRDQVLATIGDFHHPVRLVARDSELFLEAADGTLHPCGPCPPGQWLDAELETREGSATLVLNGGPPVAAGHGGRPWATWFHFGQGYPDGRFEPGSAFSVELDSVRATVGTEEAPEDRTAAGTPHSWYRSRGVTNDFEPFDTTRHPCGFTGREMYIMGAEDLFDPEDRFREVGLSASNHSLFIRIPRTKTDRFYSVDVSPELNPPAWQFRAGSPGTGGILVLEIPVPGETFGVLRGRVGLPE